jgi:hypothetical protein
MTVLEWIWAFLATSVSSAPILDTRSQLLQRAPAARGEPWETRLTFSLVSKICIGTMTGLLGADNLQVPFQE